MVVTITVNCDVDDRIGISPRRMVLYLHVDQPDLTYYEFTCPKCHSHYRRELPDEDMHLELAEAGVRIHVIQWHPESFDPMWPGLNNDDLLDLILDMREL